MAHASRRTDFTGPALVRLLASLTRAEVPGSRQAFAERLSQWVGWADAIALSAALGTATGDGAAAVSTGQVAGEAAGNSPEQRQVQHTRAALARSMSMPVDGAWAAGAARPDPGDGNSLPLARARQRTPPQAPATDATATPVPAAAADFAPLRWHYLARQQAMDAAIGPLRQHLRQSLSACGPARARLAAVDAVMERALGAQERSLLATVPALLERCFLARQREATATATATATNVTDAQDATDGWLAQFHADMHGVLLAELDLRFLPIDGLLAALHQRAARPATATPAGNAGPARLPA